ncbi:MAG: BlaB/IND/MUS family subclass B1 metallo-beta-lactamase [Leadbetterella sp.]
MRIVFSTFLFIITSVYLFGQVPNQELKISHLTGDFYVYTTYKMFGSKKQNANAMYLVTNEGVVLFDTPWDTSPFQPILDSIEARHNKKVVICIATHSHEDRTSGLDYYKQRGIKTYTTKMTDDISKANGRPRAEYLMMKDTVFNVGQYSFETFYAGGGHTKDNLVVWFEEQKILYGGCLVKSIEAKDLEYIKEADIKEWPNTIKKIQAKCKNPKFIITGHHDWNSTESLNHTLKLLEENASKKVP